MSTPFVIPNLANAGFPPQSDIDSGDLSVLVAGHAGTGVVSGCAVTPVSPAGLGVVTAAGVIQVNGTEAAVSQTQSNIAAPDLTYGRFDLIVSSNTGVVSVVQGTPSTEPAYPSIPANSVVLAAVYVQVGATTITSSNITPKAVVVRAASTSGSVTLSNVSSQVVTHGLLTTPSLVVITPTSDPGAGIRWWVTKSSTTFTISLSGSASFTFDWKAFA